MKWKKGPTEFLSEKTFLVIKDDLNMLEKKGKHRGKSKTPDTSTWPPKMKRGVSVYDDPERPKTANLEKPSVLDPDLVDKLDMSLLSKELLVDSMTRFRHSKAISGGTSAFPSSSRYRHSVTAPERQRQQQYSPLTNGEAATWCNGPFPVRYKRRSFEQILDTRLGGHIDASTESPRMQKHERIISQDTVKKSLDNRKLDDNNNRNGTSGHKVHSLSVLKKKGSRPIVQNDLEVFTASSTRSAPEPCKSCGKSDQPERFHSHPKGGQQKAKDSSTNAKSKTAIPKTIQRPVALNFRSDKSKNKSEEMVVQEGKPKSANLQERSSPSNRPSSAPVKKGPRTVTCYICSREFGTASFPIHEPRCMQKWERENNSLPVNQRRPTPQRPDIAINHSEWNATAWEESQAQLIPCSKCGRTFFPERLTVHQKSCKASAKNIEPEKTENSSVEKSTSTSRLGPPMVACQTCGRNFGTRSIKIHEPQCIKRMQAEADKQSANPRRKEWNNQQKAEVDVVQETGDNAQKKTVTCYICGKDFGSTSITIHEPQCLKKWHVENDKLPLSQRRKEPERPEIIYTRDLDTGNMVIDITAMAEASWKSHLNQLVPCKRCERTFNPDRVNIHERSCKGSR
ncbi:Zinc finger protein 474 [Anthophora quadrimaculata]